METVSAWGKIYGKIPGQREMDEPTKRKTEKGVNRRYR